MLFIATCIDKSDSLAKRLGRRPAHLVYLSSLGAKVRVAGALLDPTGGSPIGSLMIFEATDEAEVRRLLAADPYTSGRAVRVGRRQAMAPGDRRSDRGVREMAHWLVKSEPSVWSFADQLAAGEKGTSWNGVRNHSAKLNLMAMKVGEQAFFYHSNAGQGGRRHRRGDQALLPRSDRRERPFRHGRLQGGPRPGASGDVGGDQGRRRLAKMVLVVNSRLSVQPVTEDEWRVVLALARPWAEAAEDRDLRPKDMSRPA